MHEKERRNGVFKQTSSDTQIVDCILGAVEVGPCPKQQWKE